MYCVLFCEIKIEEYVKEISKLKAMLKQKSEFHQLQEEEYHLKEEEFENKNCVDRRATHEID